MDSDRDFNPAEKSQKAVDGNRTRMVCLEGKEFTINLRPHDSLSTPTGRHPLTLFECHKPKHNTQSGISFGE